MSARFAPSFRSGVPHLSASGSAAASTAAPEQPKTVPLAWRHCRQYADGDLQPQRIRDDASGREFFALGNERELINLGGAAVWDRARVGFYFAAWYALSVIYSVKNKQAHIALAMPLTIATAQLVVGSALAFFFWASRVRKPPTVSFAAFRALLPIGFLHGMGHLTGVFATAVGSVSFVQVVKSGGPVWACLLSSVLLRQTVSRRVWLSLVPIVGGVALASVKELAFVWMAFVTAAASDIALALRNVLSKISMDKPQAGNMTPANSFYLFTCLSALVCLPIALGLEWGTAAAAWAAAAPSAASANALLWLIAEGGLYFTAYSEVQFLALDQISPVTHAVGNTMRRVVIMLVTILVFGTPVSLLGGVGSAIAIAGTYAYAMAKTYEAQQASNTKASNGRVDHPLLPVIKLLGRVV